MIYPEFEKFKVLVDDKNPFCSLYEIEEGTTFYLEPVFYTQLKGFKERVTEQEYDSIIERMIQVAKKNKKVVFTGSFEFPQTEVEDYIFLEITDITDPLQIYVEDKSRGSDYGD